MRTDVLESGGTRPDSLRTLRRAVTLPGTLQRDREQVSVALLAVINQRLHTSFLLH